MADRFYPLQTDYIPQLNQMNEFLNLLSGGGGGSYVLPLSTAAILGGVKVGANLAIDAQGVLSGAAPQIQADWNEAVTTSKAFILNKPTVVAQVQSDWSVTNTALKSFILNKPNFALAANLTNVENKSSATIRSEITSANVTGPLGYTPARAALNQFLGTTGTTYSVAAVDARSIANPATGIGNAQGARFRFGHTNDIDTSQGYADIIDLSTYGDVTGGGVNSLYFRKDTQQLLHKFAAAGAAAWTTKTVAYTDSAVAAISVKDDGGTRDAGLILPTTSPRAIRADFVRAETVGTNGAYAGVITFVPLDGSTVSTGDASYQLAFGSTTVHAGGVPRLRIRNGIDSTWNGFHEVVTSAMDGTRYKNITDAVVVGQLMWKAYGNNHTIFDASNSTTPSGAACNNTNSTTPWSATYPTLMGWNGANTFGVRVDSARIADSVSGASIQTSLGGQLDLSRAVTPVLYFTDTDAGLNLGRWGLYVANGGALMHVGPADDNGAVTPAITMDRAGNVFTADKLTTGGNITCGNYGYRMKRENNAIGRALIHYIDPSRYYQLITNDGDASGGFNGLRPYSVDLASGLVFMDNGLNVSSGLTVATGTVTAGSMTTPANVTWGASIYFGNSPTYGPTLASVAVTDGNIHLDPASTGVHGTYLNFYSGTGGVKFGNGASGFNAYVNADGTYVGANFIGPGSGLTGTAASLTAGAVPWAGVTGKPTTLAGYGITDGGGGVKLIAAASIGASAALDFLTLFSSEFDSYTIEIIGVLPAISGAQLQLRLAVAGTPAATGYAQLEDTTAGVALGSITSALVVSSGLNSTGLGCTATASVSGVNTGQIKKVTTDSVYQYGAAASDLARYITTGCYNGTSVVTGFRLYFHVGNFAAGGLVRVYGHKNS